MTCIPPDTLSSPDLIKMLESKKELQHELGLLVFWRRHIPDFSIIARPSYDSEKFSLGEVVAYTSSSHLDLAVILV